MQTNTAPKNPKNVALHSMSESPHRTILRAKYSNSRLISLHHKNSDFKQKGIFVISTAYLQEVQKQTTQLQNIRKGLTVLPNHPIQSDNFSFKNQRVKSGLHSTP